MCVIIDTNRFHELFHTDLYKYTLSTLYLKNGPMVCYGGSDYIKEIGEIKLKIIEQFSIINKTKKLNDNEVNQIQKKLESNFSHKDFDDPHIMAMCKASGCRLIISNDVRMKTPINYFFAAKRRPKLIRSDRNSNLIYDSNYRI